MIGRLRERIALERPQLGPDGAGGGVLAWVPLDSRPTVWARVEALTGDEPVAAEQRLSEVTYRITIRRRDDLSPECRAVWRGLALDILALVPEERRTYLTLLARAGAGQ